MTCVVRGSGSPDAGEEIADETVWALRANPGRFQAQRQDNVAVTNA